MKRPLLFALAFSLVLGTAAVAQEYPTKPIKLIIPFPPGGSNDVVGRMIATQLSEKLGKQIVVDNRGGAGGVIGTELAASAPPDGYTLLVVSIAHSVNPWLYKLKYDPIKSFAPVAMLGSGPNVLAVHPSLPVNSVKDLIALAKKEPGKLNMAHAGVGSFQHLGSSLFLVMTGLDIVMVPFKGGGPAMIDVVAGHSQVTLGSLVQTTGHIKSGKLKALGVGGTKARVHPARRADHRRGRRARLRRDQLVGHRRASRHAAADHRQAAQRRLPRCRARPDVQKQFTTEGAEVVQMSTAEFGSLHRDRDDEVGEGRQGSQHQGRVGPLRDGPARLEGGRRSCLAVEPCCGHGL